MALLKCGKSTLRQGGNMTTRLIGPGVLSWFTRGAAKVMCKFPWLMKKPTASGANTSGAFGTSKNVTSGAGAGASSVMSRDSSGNWSNVWVTDDGGKTWRELKAPNVRAKRETPHDQA